MTDSSKVSETANDIMSDAAVDKLFSLQSHGDYFQAKFSSMASPCEFLIETEDGKLARNLARLGVAEVKRIEHKFSRYAKGNLCDAINDARGKKVTIDNECHRLLTFAQTCYELSDGLFDLSSGVLRKAWRFDGSNRIPHQSQIDEVLPLVGWEHVHYDETSLQMKNNMEIDFGGIGKEYAVSRVASIFIAQAKNTSTLINLGGDIQITTPRVEQRLWTVGLESPNQNQQSQGTLTLRSGALATSGDSKRFLLHKGKRYSHILNPKTGWPIVDAPASITVASTLCVQAGCLATLALLSGKNAESFLDEQKVKYWSIRP